MSNTKCRQCPDCPQHCSLSGIVALDHVDPALYLDAIPPKQGRLCGRCESLILEYESHSGRSVLVDPSGRHIDMSIAEWVRIKLAIANSRTPLFTACLMLPKRGV